MSVAARGTEGELRASLWIEGKVRKPAEQLFFGKGQPTLPFYLSSCDFVYFDFDFLCGAGGGKIWTENATHASDFKNRQLF